MVFEVAESISAVKMVVSLHFKILDFFSDFREFFNVLIIQLLGKYLTYRDDSYLFGILSSYRNFWLANWCLEIKSQFFSAENISVNELSKSKISFLWLAYPWMSHWNTNWRCQTDRKNFDFMKRRHLENSQHVYAFRQLSLILKQNTFLESSHHTWSEKWEKSFQKQSLSFSQLRTSQ